MRDCCGCGSISTGAVLLPSSRPRRHVATVTLPVTPPPACARPSRRVCGDRREGGTCGLSHVGKATERDVAVLGHGEHVDRRIPRMDDETVEPADGSRRRQVEEPIALAAFAALQRPCGIEVIERGACQPDLGVGQAVLAQHRQSDLVGKRDGKGVCRHHGVSWHCRASCAANTLERVARTLTSYYRL